MGNNYSIGSDKVNILLEEKAEYTSLESLKKFLEKDKAKKDEFIKIRHEEDSYYVEFLPLSENGQKFFTDYILSENLGKPEITLNFFESLDTLNSFDRVLKILNHTVALQEDWAIHTYAQAFFKQIVEKAYESEDSEKINEVDEYKTLLDACNKFLITYHGKLYRELNIAIDAFRYSNNIDNVSKLIEKKKSIINNSTESFLLSPILFPMQQWKDLVLHEFSIIKDIDLLDSHKKRFISLIKELEYRIGYNKIPVISTFREVQSKDLTNIPYFYHFNWGSHFFKNQIKDYQKFITSISTEKIKSENRSALLFKLHYQEKERIELLKTRRNSKITPIKNYRHIVKGLMYLLSKINPKWKTSEVKRVAEKLVSEIFHVPLKVEKYSHQNDLKFTNQLLLEYLLLLEKSDYIKYNPKVSIPKVISKNCSLKIKGMTQSNLYHILKKLSYSPDNIQNIKLTFQGLTSEIALLNEMKN